MVEYSVFQKARQQYEVPLPAALHSTSFKFSEGEPTTSVADAQEVAKLFPQTYGAPICRIEPAETAAEAKPLRIGAVLSGGQAPGGHNVISGLYDRLKKIHADSVLLGFIAGPDGLLKNEYLEITDEYLANYRNMGGFDIIGSGRTKIETEEHFALCMKHATELELDGLVIIGGDDSNTNGAVLAETFREHGMTCNVIGVPKTIDGDLRGNGIETSFGFDSACKVYSELVGNIETDCLSAKKYWHFIRLMGRSASHITLEVGLETHPNVILVGEEVEKKDMSVAEVRDLIADVVAKRAAVGKNYGVVLVPEGLIEFIPELGRLLTHLSTELAHATEAGTLPAKVTPQWVSENVLEGENLKVFEQLPASIQDQLLLDRDPHGNIQVSRIETEKFLALCVEEELARREGYSAKFSSLCHFFGYEGRCVAPSNFDAHYCYALGHTAGLLISSGKTGLMAVVGDLHLPVAQWKPTGLPITSLFNMELRHGKMKPVIRKALVELDGPVFAKFCEVRERWAEEDAYTNPGPIQYWGPAADLTTETLALYNTA